jgi:hypothetical protein
MRDGGVIIGQLRPQNNQRKGIDKSHFLKKKKKIE